MYIICSACEPPRLRLLKRTALRLIRALQELFCLLIRRILTKYYKKIMCQAKMKMSRKSGNIGVGFPAPF